MSNTCGTAENLYLVIPAYNEQENLKDVIDQWYPIVETIGNGSRLVIVDDGSRDQTYPMLLQAAQMHPLLTPLTKPNSGHGATVLFAYHYALDHGANYVFQTDSDGQTLAEEFWPFWALRHDYDFIIGDRRIRVCFGVSVPDANTPFRLMEAETLRENLRFIPKGFHLSNVVLSVLYLRKHQRVKYLPITFRPRQGGVNSIDLPKIFKIGCRALRDFRAIDRALKQQGV